MKFLILEDEAFIAMDLSMAFDDAGHEALSASNCHEALEAIDKGDLDGAVLDVNLGGGQTCEKAAATLHEQAIPFVLHTGDLNRVGELLRDFNVPIIEKPVPSDTVVSRILDLCDQDRADA